MLVTNSGGRFARLSTGIKIFTVITLALVPLGLVALFASLDALRTADIERRASLRVAVTQSALTLKSELAGDLDAMQRGADVAASAAASAGVCALLEADFARPSRRGGHYAVFGAGLTPLCATPGFAPLRPATSNFNNQPLVTLQSGSLAINVPAVRGAAVVVVRYSAAVLAGMLPPTTTEADYAITLLHDQSTLPLRLSKTPELDHPQSLTTPIGIFGLSVSVSAAKPPFGFASTVLMFLPLLMWASAALTGFVVIDRLLIRPLRGLRRAVAAHTPGAPFQIPVTRTPAREIRDLGTAFAKFSAEISSHDDQMAKALADQTKATREVHHRVKNNLQVIASLISLHARGATAPDAIKAYAAIQRRVDALSIVHRNHYAELDLQGGIDIRGLLGELASNLRASAETTLTAPTISIDATGFGVSQDSAVAIAFFITELVELSANIDPAAAIVIAIGNAPDPEKARLRLTSSALSETPAMQERLVGRYARVLEGLARQLRSPLGHDGIIGCFEIDFAAVRRPT